MHYTYICIHICTYIYWSQVSIHVIFHLFFNMNIFTRSRCQSTNPRLGWTKRCSVYVHICLWIYTLVHDHTHELGIRIQFAQAQTRDSEKRSAYVSLWMYTRIWDTNWIEKHELETWLRENFVGIREQASWHGISIYQCVYMYMYIFIHVCRYVCIYIYTCRTWQYSGYLDHRTDVMAQPLYIYICICTSWHSLYIYTYVYMYKCIYSDIYV